MEGLPAAVREFAGYLTNLVDCLDRDGGWCGVFWQRDAAGMQACLDGREEPPWDVVEALLQDLAALHGQAYAMNEAPRARELHAASLRAYDAQPGARERLSARLGVMLREQRNAAGRQAELTRRLQTAPPDQVPALKQELAWAQDDHARASARCAELHHRLAELDRRAGADGDTGSGDEYFGVRPDAAHHAYAAPAPGGPTGPVPGGPYAAPGGPTGAAPGASYAPAPGSPYGTAPDPYGRPGTHGTAAARPVPTPQAGPGIPPRPARPDPAVTADFRTAPQDAPADHDPGDTSAKSAADQDTDPQDQAHEAAADVVATLLRLRAEGRGGEAHVLLTEAASWPPDQFPVLAVELRRAGLDADWSTLLWEAASQPLDRLVVLADTLQFAGFTTDGDSLLRQAAARPPAEVADVVLSLSDDGQERAARALLDACVRSRSPEEVARCAQSDPDRLVPLLTAAARAVSCSCLSDLRHALRVAKLVR